MEPKDQLNSAKRKTRMDVDDTDTDHGSQMKKYRPNKDIKERQKQAESYAIDMKKPSFNQNKKQSNFKYEGTFLSPSPNL